MGYTGFTAFCTDSATAAARGLECRVEGIVSISPWGRRLEFVIIIVAFGVA